MAETKKAKKHIVVFQDEEGNVLKTSFVSHEEAALPPEMPEKRGESVHHEIKFQGWDKDISSVKENLVVKAVYKEVPKEYLVMYFHEKRGIQPVSVHLLIYTYSGSLRAAPGMQ